MQNIIVHDMSNKEIASLAQWDKDVYVCVENSEITQAYNFHFFNSIMDEAFVVESTYSNSILKAKIPNVLLTQTHPITGYIRVTDFGEKKCLYRFRINIVKRPKPSDYVYVDTKDYISVSDILNECREHSESASNSAQDAAMSASNATVSAESAASSAQDAANSASSAAGSAQNADTSVGIVSDMVNSATSSANDAAISATNANKFAIEAKNAAESIPDIIPITKGGTGASAASEALSNLGAASSNHTHGAGDITSGTLDIAHGGTGANSATLALAKLGASPVGHKHSALDITSNAIPVERGGTGKTSAEMAFKVLSEDTGWIEPEFYNNSQYWTNGAESLNKSFKPVQYRKVGKQVFIDGFFMCNDTSNNFDTIIMKTLFTLPAGYHPTKQIYFRLPMTGQNYAKAYITPNGSVGLDTTSATALTTSLWFNFNNVSFFVN